MVKNQKEVRNADSKENVKKELADKLELIIAMANFYGFNLDDIILETDKKRERNGAFNKRILLVKTIKKDQYIFSKLRHLNFEE